MDRVYQTAGEDLRAIHVTRTLTHEALTATETREIWEISSDRVLVENYSWRITSFFKVFSHVYRWYKPLHSHSFRICLSLTSFISKTIRGTISMGSILREFKTSSELFLCNRIRNAEMFTKKLRGENACERETQKLVLSLMTATISGSQ